MGKAEGLISVISFADMTLHLHPFQFSTVEDWRGMRLPELDHNVVFTRNIGGICWDVGRISLVQAVNSDPESTLNMIFIWTAQQPFSLHDKLNELFEGFYDGAKLDFCVFGTWRFFLDAGSFCFKVAGTYASVSSRVLLISADLPGINTHKMVQNTRSERFPESVAGPFEISLWSIGNVSFIVDWVCASVCVC